MDSALPIPVRPSRRGLLAAAATLPALAGCSAVGVFNAVVPTDGGVDLIADGLAYGPDPRQRLDVYAPRTAAVTASPAILFIYGGSWNSGDRGTYGFVGRALAARGHRVAIMDYRLVPSVRFPAFVEDAALATRFLQVEGRRYGIGPSGLVVMGHSAGAHIAAMLTVTARYQQAAGVTGRPIRGLVGLAGPYDFYPFDVSASVDAFGAWPEPQDTQPVAVAMRGAPPAFLAHGTADTTVKPRNTTALAARLRALGTPVTERLYPGLDHADVLIALARPFRDKAPILDEVDAFVRACA